MYGVPMRRDARAVKRPGDDLLDGVVGQHLAEQQIAASTGVRCRDSSGGRCGRRRAQMPRSRAASSTLWAAGSMTPGLSSTVQQPRPMPSHVGRATASRPASTSGIDQQFVQQLLGLLRASDRLRAGSRARASSELGAVALAVRQQVVIPGATRSPFRVVPLRPDFNFPEHRVPSWLGPAVRRALPSRRLIKAHLRNSSRRS